MKRERTIQKSSSRAAMGAGQRVATAVAIVLSAAVGACGDDDAPGAGASSGFVDLGALATNGTTSNTTQTEGGVTTAGTGLTGGNGGATNGLSGFTSGFDAGLTGVDASVTGSADAGATTGDSDAGASTGATGGTTAGNGSSTTGNGSCCGGGDCICRGDAPSGLDSSDGPYATDSYDLSGVGCVHYPTDAEPPFAAVAVSDGYLGSGGCGAFAQTSGWGPFYASHGIVAMIINTSGQDQPDDRGRKLLGGIEGFKSENGNAQSPLYQKLAGRYGTSGFSMGGGGTTRASRDDSTLRSSVGLMAWRPVGDNITVPTLFLCDPSSASDTLAACPSHSDPAYDDMPSGTPKMIVEFNSGHDGQPDAAGGMSGAIALAFQKLFLEGDERWRSVLLDDVDYRETTIK